MATVRRLCVAALWSYQQMLLAQIVEQPISPELHAQFIELGFEQVVEFTSADPGHSAPLLQYKLLHWDQLLLANLVTRLPLIDRLATDAKQSARLAQVQLSLRLELPRSPDESFFRIEVP
mgnify:CR=1 FL=1